MDEIKKISEEEFNVIASEHTFQRKLLIKDYFVTSLLYFLKDVNGIYFKGGTALQKIFLNHTRLSEDIDFSLTREVSDVKKEIVEIIEKSELFGSISEDKNVEGFLRIVVGYTGFGGEKDNIFIDLNQRAKLSLPFETHKINHFYNPFIPEFSIKTLAKEEMIAEKTAATIGRNKPRDHYDVYMILKKGITINIKLVKKKCHDSGDEFSIIKMFNNAKKLKNRWDKDMEVLITKPITFQEVIKFLSKHFKLKEEKRRQRESKFSKKPL